MFCSRALEVFRFSMRAKILSKIRRASRIDANGSKSGLKTLDDFYLLSINLVVELCAAQ